MSGQGEKHAPPPQSAPSLLTDLDHRLRLEVERWLAAGRDPADALRGLYVGDDEARALAGTAGLPERREWPELVLQRLARLTSLFGLTSHEAQVLLAAALPDLDLRYERLYAYLQDDMARRRPIPDLLLRLLASSPEERFALRGIFSSSGRLQRHGLLGRGPGAESGSMLASALHADERVVAYLIGSEAVDERLRSFARLLPTDQGDLSAPLLGQDPLESIMEAFRAAQSACLVVIEGPRGVGKTRAARSLAGRLRTRLLGIDAAGLIRADLEPRLAVGLVFRESALQECLLYWANAAALWEDGERPARARGGLLEEVAEWRGLVFLAGPSDWAAASELARLGAVRLSLSMPATQQRVVIWQEALASEPNAAELQPVASSLASGFRLTPGQVRDAVAVARSEAAVRGPRRSALTPADLFAGSRAVSSRALTAVADEVSRHASWAELVLPADALAQLQELCAMVRCRGTVLDDWGFSSRITAGTGITALFAGASGTGKTMAAGVVAAELGLPIFRIDLARVVSKWIGETEKNLEQVFRAAEDSNAVLFLDEAEALLGKRSEIRDSHDRYANLEISYLLQKMELYDGVAILATNMPHLIDQAFLRRLAVAVTFPMPDEDQRYRIWQAIWPPQLPRAEEVDLGELARFKLAGGNIKNVLLAAAYLAASQASPVTMAHLRHGLRREYQKLGKELTEAELR